MDPDVFSMTLSSATQDRLDVTAALKALNAACAKDSPEMLAYFRKEWFPNLTMWVRAFRGDKAFDTNAVIESYHGLIKGMFFSQMCVGCSVDALR